MTREEWNDLTPAAPAELRRLRHLRVGTVEEDTTLAELETLLLSRGARVSVAGRDGEWAAWVWLADGRTRGGRGRTIAAAVSEALKPP